MRAYRYFAACVVVGALLVAAAPAAGSELMVQKVNEARRAHGLPSLRYSPSLSRTSARFARHQVVTDRFGHASRIWASSRFTRLGELLALQRGWRIRRSSAVRMWLRSSGHRAYLLGRHFRYAGAGRARGRMGTRMVTVWVVQLGSL
jgi:uncharacterized protein YkwD